jgi:tetratricopeptide (TPR) repeat protein
MVLRVLPVGFIALALVLSFAAVDARAQPPAADLYVVVLATLANMAQQPVAPLPAGLRGKSLYWRLLKSGDRVSYQLCLGFFDTRGDAERARKQLAANLRKARVIPVNRMERDNLAKALQKAKSLSPAPAIPPVAPSPAAALQPATTPAPPRPPAAPAPAGSAEALMAEGRSSIVREDYAAAVRAYIQLLALPQNDFSRDAQEFLGLAYERRRDAARARLEYEKYLKRYPEGEDSVRVRQRLANLSSTPRPVPLRAPVQTVGGWRSFTFGSLSQFYYRGNSTIETQQVVPAANTLDRTTLSLTDQSALITNIDASTRFVDATHDNRIVFRDMNMQNFLIGQRDINRVNAAYYEYKYKPADASARLGRQPGNAGGLLGRFDGALLGYGLMPALRLNLVGGEPVDLGVTIDSKRRFLGTSVDVGPLNQHWSGSVYFIRQTIDSVIDREATGMELRYFAPQGSFSSMVDYDTVFRRINIGTVQGNWLAPWKTAFNFLADYRMTPALQAGTATLGEASTSVQTLLSTYSEDELRQRALALTAKSALASAGVTHPLSDVWQIGADVRASRISHTEGTNLVPGMPGTGYVYTYTGQIIGIGLFAKRDVSVISGSRITAPDFRGSAARLASRAPLGERWTLDGSVLWYGQDNDNGSTLQRVSPTARLGYRWGNSMTLELEAGAESTSTSSATIEEKTRRSFFSLGYRWDF